MLSRNPPDEDFALSNAYWYANLSNGEVIYQSADDTWIHLQDYITKNNLRVIHFGLKFRSNTVVIPILPSYKYLYLANAVGKEWTDENTEKFFIFGFSDNEERVSCYWYKLPELTEKFKTLKNIDEIPRDKNFLYKVPSA